MREEGKKGRRRKEGRKKEGRKEGRKEGEREEGAKRGNEEQKNETKISQNSKTSSLKSSFNNYL